MELGAYICVTADEPINQLTTDYPVCAVTHVQSDTGMGDETIDTCMRLPFEGIIECILCKCSDHNKNVTS